VKRLRLKLRLRLPKVDGLEVLRRIKLDKTTRKTPSLNHNPMSPSRQR
jgi:CheY-like chemotaxis protein